MHVIRCALNFFFFVNVTPRVCYVRVIGLKRGVM